MRRIARSPLVMLEGPDFSAELLAQATILSNVFFFFGLIILAFDLYRSWRRTFCPVFLSAVRAVAARCKLPFCPPPRPVPRKSRRAQGT